MNCRPGDLAYITHPSMLGKLVTVLHEAPSGVFLLPNGVQSAGKERCGDWAIQSMGAPFHVRRNLIGDALNEYAVCNDRWLRPIRGDGITDDTPVDVERPVTVGA